MYTVCYLLVGFEATVMSPNDGYEINLDSSTDSGKVRFTH